jgi:hypothetical protein
MTIIAVFQASAFSDIPLPVFPKNTEGVISFIKQQDMSEHESLL